jgi:hypothetical protein
MTYDIIEPREPAVLAVELTRSELELLHAIMGQVGNEEIADLAEYLDDDEVDSRIAELYEAFDAAIEDVTLLDAALDSSEVQ